MGYLLSVLTSMMKTVGAGGLCSDLLGHPGGIAFFVLGPHFPLACVIGERLLVHHGDTVVHRADGLTDAAAAAGLHVCVIETVRGDGKTGIRITSYKVCYTKLLRCAL